MQASPSGSHTAWFSYLDEPPSAWPQAIHDLKARGITRLRTPILWGAHESLQGVRDFTKCSRLRLERFIAQVHEQQLELECILGFPAARETFPAWTLRLDRKAWVQTSSWSEEASTVLLTEVPSLFEPSFTDAFLSFLEEAASILALYRAPEGPLHRLWIDLGIYQADMNALDSPEYTALLASRYPGMETFNQRYQTTFRQFEGAATRSALRVLSDRRAWLAAYDYKWCRERLLDGVLEKVLRLDALQPLSDRLQVLDRSDAQLSGKEDWGIAVDPTLLELAEAGQPRLFTPGGIFHPSAVASFRLTQFLRERCEAEGRTFRWLPLRPSGTGEPAIWVVVCGKYLSREAMQSLWERVERGGRVYFPFGLPQYDQDMKSHEALSPLERLEGTSILRASKGQGAIWISAKPVEPTAEGWEEVCQTVGSLDMGGRA